MKKLLLLSTLILGVPPLIAQQAANRENIGETPATLPDKPPGAPGGETASEKSPDIRFLQQSGQAGQKVVKIAEMAVNKTLREDLKAFAVMLVKDHGAVTVELRAIARKMGVDIPDASHSAYHGKDAYIQPANDPSGRQPTEIVPTDPSKEGNPDHTAYLKDKSGLAFDAAFMEIMGKCHQDEIAMFERAQGRVNDPTLKAFVSKTLPMLRSHAAALTALERKDPNRPDARTAAPPGPTAPTTPVPDALLPTADDK